MANTLLFYMHVSYIKNKFKILKGIIINIQRYSW